MAARIITDYLEEIAERLPDKVAYTDETREITFSAFRKEAYHVAQMLVEKNWFRKPVAIYLDKSVSCLAAMLGTAYSGNFYTVIDTAMPAARIQKILSVLEPAAILTGREYAETVAAFSGDAEVLFYEDAQEMTICREEILRASSRLQTTDVLYVLFTSGSTGVPKGVVTPHRALIDYMEAVTDAFSLSENEVFGNQAPFYFVMSVVEVFSTLRNGSTMHIVPKSYFSFPAMLMKFLEEKKITMLYWVPSALVLLANLRAYDAADLSALKKIAFGGEVMPLKQLNMWRRALPEITFINQYGPTETTDGTTYYILDREFADNETLPIGVPFANIGVLVLDENGQEVVGEGMGELCVYGPSITYGYYGDPERTASVFTQNPLNGKFPEKIYHTGDLVRWNDYGELEFAGRKDFQIKHLGHRIELGEIEANVASVPEIQENCCLYDSKKRRIVLYYTGKMEDGELLKKLEGLLPDYMVPNRRICLDEMPHNLNGKIDRAELKRRLEG